MSAPEVRGALVVLVVRAGDEDREEDLDDCLTRLVAAADDAAASGIAVVLVAALPVPHAACAALVERWRELAATLESVTVRAVHGPGREAAAAGLADPALSGLGGERVLVLSTDTGSTVGRDWILGHAAHVTGGVLASTAAVVPAVRAGDPASAAAHAVGSNLAVRADAYLAAGGFPGTPTTGTSTNGTSTTGTGTTGTGTVGGETEAELLWRAVRQLGGPVCHALTPLVTCRAYGSSGARR
ncbi:hypothetical protein NUM3379_43470 [Kineococcus sp. NUM-3379]